MSMSCRSWPEGPGQPVLGRLCAGPFGRLSASQAGCRPSNASCGCAVRDRRIQRPSFEIRIDRSGLRAIKDNLSRLNGPPLHPGIYRALSGFTTYPAAALACARRIGRVSRAQQGSRWRAQRPSRRVLDVAGRGDAGRGAGMAGGRGRSTARDGGESHPHPPTPPRLTRRSSRRVWRVGSAGRARCRSWGSRWSACRRSRRRR